MYTVAVFGIKQPAAQAAQQRSHNALRVLKCGGWLADVAMMNDLYWKVECLLLLFTVLEEAGL